jgi:hypothetical protein
MHIDCRGRAGRRDGREGDAIREALLLFLFFSNRLGCLGSIVVSVILTAALVLLLRSCSY